MRFLQIHHFYEAYLDEFYARRPNLHQSSYADQMREILDDGFSNAHIITPYLNKLGVQTQFVVANALPTQAKWMSENGFQHLDAHHWMHQIAKHQVDAFKPDILYLSHPIEFDERFIQQLSWKPRFIMGFRAAPIPPGCNFSSFDLMLSTMPSLLDQCKGLGVSHVEFYRPGFPNLVLEQLGEVQQEVDVAFSGQWTSQHEHRNHIITEVARYHEAHPEQFSLKLYIANIGNLPLPDAVVRINHGARWALDMYRALRSARMNINAMIGLGGGCANMRLFEATGVGSMVLQEDRYDVEEFFQRDSELVTFETSDELLEKIIDYRNSPEKRKAVAEAGQSRCLRDHSMEVRVQQFIDCVEKYSPLSFPRTDTFQDPGQEVNKAIRALQKNDFQSALHIIDGVLESNVPVRDSYHVLAICLLQQEKLEDAVNALQRELSLYSDNSAAQALLKELSQG